MPEVRGSCHHHLAVENVNVTAEVLGDDAPAQLSRLLGHVRHLQEHRARKVTTLK